MDFNNENCNIKLMPFYFILYINYVLGIKKWDWWKKTILIILTQKYMKKIKNKNKTILYYLQVKFNHLHKIKI
jgi:hypothetical protein